MSSHEGPESTTEILDFGVREPRPRNGAGRRNLAAATAAVVGVGAVAAGFWAWHAWSATGPQPAEALPGSTLAYAAVDLDPAGGQKVAAFRALRKVPSLRKELGLDSTEDVSRSVVEGIAADGDCHLDYAHDVKPWIGDRAAVALVAQGKPEPVAVLQVTDATKAGAGLKALAARCDGDFGYVVDGQWAVLARNTAVATRATRDAGAHPLSADKDFKALTTAAGDPGLVTVYAAPEAGKALLEEIERDPFTAFTAAYALNALADPATSFVSGFGALAAYLSPIESTMDATSIEDTMTPEQKATEKRLMKRMDRYDELTKSEQDQLSKELDQLYSSTRPVTVDEGGSDSGDVDMGVLYPAEQPALSDELRSSLQKFSGLGGIARFEGGRLEVQIVGDSLQGTAGDLYAGAKGDDVLAKLPARSAVAYGAGFAHGWAGALISQFTEQFNYTGQTEKQVTHAFEKATGLAVPEDVEALGGDGLAVVAGAGFDPDQDADKVQVAVRVSGDPDKIEAALDKVRRKVGAGTAAYLGSRRIGDDVVIGPDADYLAQLAKGGDTLGDSDRFGDVAPDAKDATTVLYTDFDAGDWLTKLASPSDRADVAPLDALGLTITRDDGQQRMRFRLSFD